MLLLKLGMSPTMIFAFCITFTVFGICCCINVYLG